MTDQPQATGAAQRAADLASIRQTIAAKEAEYEELLARLRDIDSYANAQGQHDARRYKLDELRKDELANQIRKLERSLVDAEKQSSEWTNYAARKAADFIRGRLPRLAENLRDAVRDEFTRQVKTAMDTGTFQRPDTQSAEAVEHILRDRFDYAVGRAYSASLPEDGDDEPQAQRRPAPKDAGLDERNAPPEEEPEDDGFGDDEEARRLFQSYTPPRKRKSRTLWEIQQEQRAARAKERDE